MHANKSRNGLAVRTSIIWIYVPKTFYDFLQTCNQSVTYLLCLLFIILCMIALCRDFLKKFSLDLNRLQKWQTVTRLVGVASELLIKHFVESYIQFCTTQFCCTLMLLQLQLKNSFGWHDRSLRSRYSNPERSHPTGHTERFKSHIQLSSFIV